MKKAHDVPHAAYHTSHYQMPGTYCKYNNATYIRAGKTRYTCLAIQQ